MRKGGMILFLLAFISMTTAGLADCSKADGCNDGEFLSDVADGSPGNGNKIVIDLKKQKLFFYKKGKLVLRSAVSTGRVGHETPTGEFSVIGKEVNHRSNLYPIRENGKNGGAAMPYMLRITNDGVAIHGGKVPKYPNSHGCIRVPYSKARKLYKLTPLNTKVVIVGYPKYNDRYNKMREKILLAKMRDRDKKGYLDSEFHPYRGYGDSKGAKVKSGGGMANLVDERVEKDLIYLDDI